MEKSRRSRGVKRGDVGVRRVFAVIVATALVLLTLAIPTTVVVALWHLFAPKTVADIVLFVLTAEILWLFIAAVIAYAIKSWCETLCEEEEEEEEDGEGDECE